ncbi:MFS transporter [Bacillus cereus]|uniref:MFS transporter n=1 Tax=Bacillus cereus TaxID=1396 RepID=A0AA44Q9P8_BACCE|nr:MULTISPECIES: MFS transporter [Bacillus cereus group]PFA14583.1 MFS transporter [Bacillus cereus]PFN00357.1 MFS transporter [Bacillus cereus]PFO78801.1 MFS transporter [Bacillus cereus]PFR26538.1 MFS transporter [Bacillus cereus]PFR99841.1 MFS transporter [Bacillus cereus]
MSTRFTFWIMVGIVAISGLSQGMLLPAIAMIFEQEGVRSSFNGIHATALYIGILFISPWLEKPMQRFGMKPIIVIGGFLVIISLFFFTQTFSFWAWFILRFLVGVGDHMLHVGTQTWITTTSDPSKIGRQVSIYGVFFGIGFAVGPYLASTVQYGLATPFIVSTILCLIGWLLLLPTKNAFPEQDSAGKENESSLSRYKQVFVLAWIALMGPLAYGVLEAMLNSNLPVYALRKGWSVADVSFLLPAFAIGGIITQIPLGILSDKYGRDRILTWTFSISTIVFLFAAVFDEYYWIVFGCMLLAGMVIGSCFSLGLGFMTDLLPRHLLPAGNILSGIAFSIGSIMGPVLGGIFIEKIQYTSLFIAVMMIMAIIALLYIAYMKSQFASRKIESRLGHDKTT